LARVLASKPLLPSAAAQLTKLWRGEFQVTEEGETFTVRTPTFQSVDQFITAELAKPDYAHFLRAQNPGGGTGGTAGGSQAAPPGEPEAAKDYATLGDYLMDLTKARQAAQGTNPMTNLRLAVKGDRATRTG
jgi:hypothetical protein